jgi:hypothetical protein
MTILLPARDRVPRFDPRQLSGLLNRYQADKFASASQWNDLSGGSRNATQGTAAQQPVYSATAYNGFPGITFDGTNDNLALPDSVTGAKTIAVSYRMTSTFSAMTLRSLVRLLHGTTRSEVCLVNANFYQNLTFFFDFTTSGGTARGASLTLDTNPHTVIVTYNGGTNTTSANYTCFVDGVSASVVASSTINASASSVGSIGGRATSSGFEIYPNPSTYFRLLVYQGAKTSAECALIHDWLRRGYQ